MTLSPIRLSVNIDHVATMRNARGGAHPDVLRAAEIAIDAGADAITVHLREDRRHIRDADLFALKQKIAVPLNFEAAATDEMMEIALRLKPHMVTMVPENRLELTTEGGLDVLRMDKSILDYTARLRDANIIPCAFVEPDLQQVTAAKSAGFTAIELHTGTYANADATARMDMATEIARIAAHAQQMKMICNAGHGLDYQNVLAIAAIPEIQELSIGHFLIGEALFTGLAQSVRHMRFLMDQARNGIAV